MAKLLPSNPAEPVNSATAEFVPNFEAVAKEVLKRSIRSAVCIDDKYASAYSVREENEALNFEEPAQLYSTFREEGLCDIDIYQFKSFDDSWKRHMSQNKDLLILDWELDPGERYDSTLQILEDVVNENKIPFVVIYTNTEDLHNVAKALISTFNNSAVDSYITDCKAGDKFFGFLSEDKDGIDCASTFEALEQELYEYFHHYSKRVESKDNLMHALLKSFKIKPENKERFLIKFETTFGHDGGDALLELAGAVTNKNNNKSSIKRIEIEPHAYKINGTIILIYHKLKGNEKKEWGVKPEELFHTLSTALTNNPHSFLNLLALEFKERLRENFSIIGTNFASFNETAFMYHLTNYREDGKFNLRYIYDFILKSWIGELHNQKLNEQSDVLNLLEERYQGLKSKVPDPLTKENTDFLKELINYSAFISNSDLKKRTDLELRFGDLFQHNEEYFLCITPLCDCARPKKINNNFYFVKGVISEDYEALTKAETGFYSFVTVESKSISIEWKTKPFTIYVPTNNITALEIEYCGKKKKLDHLTVLKENYAQRIANQSFGYGFRVGIDLPHIKGQDEQDPSMNCAVAG